MPTNEELQNQITDLQRRLDHFTDIFYRQHDVDKDVFNNPVYINGNIFFKDGTVLLLGGTTGMRFGNSGEKIGFLGSAPVAKQSAISAPAGGATIDSQARSAIGTIINVLKLLGFTA